MNNAVVYAGCRTAVRGLVHIFARAGAPEKLGMAK